MDHLVSSCQLNGRLLHKVSFQLSTHPLVLAACPLQDSGRSACIRTEKSWRSAFWHSIDCGRKCTDTRAPWRQRRHRQQPPAACT